MDEILFRSSQKLENLQVQLSLARIHSKEFLEQYFLNSKTAVIEAWNGPHAANLKTLTNQVLQYLLKVGRQVKEQLWLYVDPQKLYYNLVKVIYHKWTKRDMGFLFVGFACGGIIGFAVALSIKRKDSVIRYMQAVQCSNYLGIESASVAQNAIVPNLVNDNEVIISVKAASIQVIDAKICSGYGKLLRRTLQNLYNKHFHGSWLPVTLGRDCTGVITDIGSDCKRLEIGDEVWVTVPFWYEGTLSQNFVVPEYRVARKPKNIGFEGACSLPYAGCLAFNALKKIGITEATAKSKKIFIMDGCTPVGCVLIQILNTWEAVITTSCSARAVPVAKALGATDIVVSPESNKNDDFHDSSASQDVVNALIKELELKDKFDHILITKDNSISKMMLTNFCHGKVVSTWPGKLASDSCGLLGRIIVGGFIYTKYLFERLLRISLNDYDEAHMCYASLDQLSELVESGCLQTVVDKVFQPQDIEIALNHIQSYDSIGSTVISFR